MQLKQEGSGGMYEKLKSFVKSGNTRFKMTSTVPQGGLLSLAAAAVGGKCSP